MQRRAMKGGSESGGRRMGTSRGKGREARWCWTEQGRYFCCVSVGRAVSSLISRARRGGGGRRRKEEEGGETLFSMIKKRNSVSAAVLGVDGCVCVEGGCRVSAPILYLSVSRKQSHPADVGLLIDFFLLPLLSIKKSHSDQVTLRLSHKLLLYLHQSSFTWIQLGEQTPVFSEVTY